MLGSRPVPNDGNDCEYADNKARKKIYCWTNVPLPGISDAVSISTWKKDRVYFTKQNGEIWMFGEQPLGEAKVASGGKTLWRITPPAGMVPYRVPTGYGDEAWLKHGKVW